MAKKTFLLNFLFNSTDYRAAFHKQFPWLHKFLAAKKQSAGGGTVIVQFVKSRASSITPVEKPL